jgi:hypothetical protein
MRDDDRLDAVDQEGFAQAKQEHRNSSEQAA